MSCPKCERSYAVGAARGPTQELNEPVEKLATNAAMCLLCKHGGERETCALTNKAIIQLTVEGSCPIGRHSNPQTSGIVVKWRKLRWYGVPKLERRRLPEQYKIPGCGCIKVLKDGWVWVKEKSRILAALFFEPAALRVIGERRKGQGRMHTPRPRQKPNV